MKHMKGVPPSCLDGKCCSVIVSLYRQQRFVPLVFDLLQRQTRLPDEIIFAEDEESESMYCIVEELRQKYPNILLRHVSQPDIGFRKAMIVNKAVALARHDILIFLDGDCFPERHMVEEYVEAWQPGRLLFSRPVYVPAKMMEQAIAHRSLAPLSFLGLLRGGAKGIDKAVRLPFKGLRWKRGRSMNGANWCCGRTDYLAVNGYDEAFGDSGYGFEDEDIARRMGRLGVIEYSLKNRVVYYHYGIPGEGDGKGEGQLVANQSLLVKNNVAGTVRCQRGIDQWLSTSH